MTPVWTHCAWTVRPGREEEFVELWKGTVRETAKALAPPQRPSLLRDHDRQNLFISFGPWNDVEQVEAFRSSDAFRRAQAPLRDVLEGFEPRTLDEVVAGG